MSFLCPFYVLFGFFSDSFSLFGRVRRGNGFILFERPNSLKETFKLLKFHFLRKKWTLFLQKCTEMYRISVQKKNYGNHSKMENTFTRVTHMELRSFVDGLRMFYLGLTFWNHLNRPLLLVSLGKRIWPRCKNLQVEAKVQIPPWRSTLRIFHVKCIAWIPWVPGSCGFFDVYSIAEYCRDLYTSILTVLPPAQFSRRLGQGLWWAPSLHARAARTSPPGRHRHCKTGEFDSVADSE